MRIFLFGLLTILLSSCLQDEPSPMKPSEPIQSETTDSVETPAQENTPKLGEVNSKFSIWHLSLEWVTPRDSGDTTEIESIPLLLTDIWFSTADNKKKLSLQLHDKLHLWVHKNTCLALEYEDIEQLWVAVFCESDIGKTPGTALEIEIDSIETLDTKRVIINGSVYGSVLLSSGIKGNIDENYRPITTTEVVKVWWVFTWVILDVVGLRK